MITISKSTSDRLYHARIGRIFERTGRTKAEAREACEQAIVAQVENLCRQRYVWTQAGPIFVLYYVDGWCYDIIRPHQRPSTTIFSLDTSEREAYQAMMRHIDQAYGGAL